MGPRTDTKRERTVGRTHTGRKACLKDGTRRRNSGTGSGAGLLRSKARHERRGTARANVSTIVATREGVRKEGGHKRSDSGMNGMKNGSRQAATNQAAVGSRQAAVNGMDGEGNGSVTMETLGRHGSTKTRHGSTKTSGRIIADSMDVSSGRKNIESDMINETTKKR